MLYKTFFLVLLLFESTLLSAQQFTEQERMDYDYEMFKQTFEKEVVDDTIVSANPILHPASTPGVFSHIPSSSSDMVFAIGISDPGMEKEIAVKLAISRAKMIAAFMVSPEVSVMVDNYSNEKQKKQSSEFVTRYSDFFKLKSKLLIDTNNFQVEKLEFTSFDEAVVLIRYSIPSDTAAGIYIAEANVYQNERQKQVHLDTEGKFYLKGIDRLGDSIFNSTSYGVTSLNNTSDIHSELEELALDFNYRNYRYISDTTNKDNTSGSKLTYGLWKAFAEQFLNSVYYLSQNSAIDIKLVDDNYSSGKQTLSRELIKSHITFQLSEVIVFDNRLSVILNPIK